MMQPWDGKEVRRRPLRMRGVLPSVLVAVLAGAALGASQAETTASRVDPPLSDDAPAQAFDPAALLASAADADARRQAAREVLQRFAADASLSLPQAWLAEEPAASLRLLDEAASSPEAAEALASAIVRASRPVDGLNGARVTAPADMSSDARLVCLTLLSRSSDPAAAEVLVGWLESSPVDERSEIVDALVSMSGRADLGQSPEAWRQWLARHRHLPPIAWRSMLVDGLRTRAERLDQRERDLLRALVDSSRRLYAALPAADRPAALARMLADSEAAIRLAATDLLLRDLERGVAPAPEVSAAVVRLLDDPEADIRQAAAVLVDRIVPEGSAARLSVALRREANPDVAAVMLRAFRRSPDATAIDAVLRWLEHGEPTRVAAIRAVASLLEAGFEPSVEQRERVLAQIDPQNASALTPAGVHVLARLGDRADRDVLRSLLFSPRPEIRRATVEALLPDPAHVNDLLLAAEADPSLLQRAADAVAIHKPWAPSLRRVAMLEMRVPMDAQSAESLPITVALARLLPMPERLAASQTLVGHPLAIRAILGTPRREDFADGPAGDRDLARARSLLNLPERRAEPAESQAEPEPASGEAPPPSTPPG